MELKQLTEHIWILPYEEERDRPNLGYVRGDRWSLAVDAGHSAAHTQAFYALLEQEKLPLPSLTVLTHGHWDHTFGMHAVRGLCLACGATNRYLAAWQERIAAEGPDAFLTLHETVRREYAGGVPVTVRTADLEFSGEIALDLGGCRVRILQTEAPHTDDSVLVYVCQDRTLFVGDAAGGVFPTGVRDPDLCRKLADRIRAIGPRICVEGHWVPVATEDLLSDLLG